MKRNPPFLFAIVFILFTALTVAPLAAKSRPEGTPLPIYQSMAVRMADEDATSGATSGGGKPLKPRFIGIPSSVNAHRIVGYTSGGLLLAGGVVGIVRFLDLKDRSHERRDNGEGGNGHSDGCADIIHEEWADGQALRWTHVGLVASGEALYLFDAATGISMMKQNKSPSRAGRIHRNAFFVHAGLMAADVILGFLLTNALDKGEHDKVVAYGAAHAGIGLTIPLVIIGSGLAVDLMPRY